MYCGFRANNSAEAYAYGLDLRLNGEFVPGTESWFSFGYLKTEENINNRGYIARPTDQRVNFSLFFQDYIPGLESFKMHIALYYSTGLPFGPPNTHERHKATLRIPDYKRVDLGFSYLIKAAEKHNKSKVIIFISGISTAHQAFNISPIVCIRLS